MVAGLLMPKEYEWLRPILIALGGTAILIGVVGIIGEFIVKRKGPTPEARTNTATHHGSAGVNVAGDNATVTYYEGHRDDEQRVVIQRVLSSLGDLIAVGTALAAHLRALPDAQLRDGRTQDEANYMFQRWSDLVTLLLNHTVPSLASAFGVNSTDPAQLIGPPWRSRLWKATNQGVQTLQSLILNTDAIRTAITDEATKWLDDWAVPQLDSLRRSTNDVRVYPDTVSGKSETYALNCAQGWN